MTDSNAKLIAQVEAYVLRNGITKTILSNYVFGYGSAFQCLRQCNLGPVSKQAFSDFMAANPDAVGIKKARAKLTEKHKAENRRELQAKRYSKYYKGSPAPTGYSERIDLSKLTRAAGDACFKCGANPNKLQCKCLDKRVTFIVSAVAKIIGDEA